MDPREWLFDKRVVRRNLDKGVLGIKVFNDYLKSLDDLEGEFDRVELEAKTEPSRDEGRQSGDED